MRLAGHDADDWLTTKQVTELVPVKREWLIVARKTVGRGPPHYRIGGRVYYRASQVLAWLRSRRSEGGWRDAGTEE